MTTKDTEEATTLLICKLRVLPLKDYILMSHQVHGDSSTENKYEALRAVQGESTVRLLVWYEDMIYQAWIVDHSNNRISDYYANNLLELMEEII